MQLAIIGCAISNRVIFLLVAASSAVAVLCLLGSLIAAAFPRIQTHSAIFSAGVSTCLPWLRARLSFCGYGQPLAFYRSPDARRDLDRVPIRRPRADNYWNLLWCCRSAAGQPDRPASTPSGVARERCRTFVVGDKVRPESRWPSVVEVPPGTGSLHPMAIEVGCFSPTKRQVCRVISLANSRAVPEFRCGRVGVSACERQPSSANNKRGVE